MRQHTSLLHYLVATLFIATLFCSCHDSGESKKEDDGDNGDSSSLTLSAKDIEAYFAFDGNFYDSSSKNILLTPDYTLSNIEDMSYSFEEDCLSVRSVDVNGYGLVTEGFGAEFNDGATVAISIKPSSVHSDQVLLRSSGDLSKGFVLKYLSDGRVLFSVGGVECASDVELLESRWHRVVASYVDGEVRLYVDGDLVGSAVGSVTTTVQEVEVAPSVVGGFLIDELMITSQRFTADEIQALSTLGFSLNSITTTADMSKYIPARSVVNMTGTPSGVSAEIHYKRGVAAPGLNGFLDSENMRAFIDVMADCGVNIFNGIRNIYKDKPYTDEFYRDESGNFATRQIDAFTDIRAYAAKYDIEMISQVGGIASFDVDGKTLFREDPAYYNATDDYAPLPDILAVDGERVSPYDEYIRCFSEWAINADKAVAESIGRPNYHSIWIGTQEVSHTLGYPVGFFSLSRVLRLANTKRYIDYWKPIAESLHAAGAKVGGVQLNSGDSDIYLDAVDYMVKQGLEIDYFTVQFYQWGVVEDLEIAVEAVKRYNENMGRDAKIIIDRGAYQKVSFDYRRSILLYLKGEKRALDFADHIYAYTLDLAVTTLLNTSAHQKPEWYTRLWMNRLGDRRRPLTNLPDGVDGFMTTRDGELYGVLWNEAKSDGGEPREITLSLEGCDLPQSAELSVRRFYGLDKSVSIYDKDKNNPGEVFDIEAMWSSKTKTISGLKMSDDEYLLIELK